MYKKQSIAIVLALFIFGASCMPVRAGWWPVSNQNKAFIAAGSLVTMYGCKLFQHWWKLHTIEKELHTAIVRINKKFPLISWRYAEFNTPHDITGKPKEIIDTLKEDKYSLGDVKKELAQEKEALREWLAYAGSMCDAPGFIIEQIRTLSLGVDSMHGVLSESIGKSRVPSDAFPKDFFKGLSGTFTDHEKLMQLVDRGLFNTKNGAYINSNQSDLENLSAPHVGALALFRPGLNPLNWVVAPCYKKARSVYFDVFKEYIRLHALETVVKGMPDSSLLKKTLKSISACIQTLITDRGSVDGNNELKLAWIAQLGAVKSQVKDLSEQDSSKKDDKIVTGLNDVFGTLKTVGQQIMQTTKPENDPIVPFLGEAKKKIDELI